MDYCVIAEWEDGTLDVYGPFTTERSAERAEERVEGFGHVWQARTMPLISAGSLRADLAAVNRRAL